ncbi:MAG: heme NO-binding domain-containing protein [gamma proteobacterium symbiont of Bathyaustriella thionipta]|nr:heme NO-binding domain-containing protein [gamma proteobacterium symbiont of Bathyaustriella thionipta]MCU7948788.1 heme NO-binding domain-containing protein [gamma proteobacterium symbiont of Bathyaustriella thionipta]MCU7954200.1 heme NO-binding domain-containing protein [gamma proteobacterium symbiont of Bathyaustriella thionipta]MCU7955246.1 heme NO-binding domain-containing protein [gamma proteobacterium symbiont of Bathyaustriella thionipta]MCU7966255.1 heme NO-binding domain-containin
MKGIVFTVFLEFVEEIFDADRVDDIIELAALPSEGAYTSVGTYNHQEMLQLVSALSELSHIPVHELVNKFGRHLFGCLSSAHPQFLEGVDSSFQLLASIEDYIHVEVRKLYPDAELPRFEYKFPRPEQMIMTYHSTRPFGDLAQGLIEGCIAHFGENIRLEREELSTEKGFSTRFILRQQD